MRTVRRKEKFYSKKFKEKKLKSGQLYWELLKVIGMTLVSGGGSVYRPMLPIAIGEVVRIIKEISKANIREESIRKSLKNLEKKEIIDLIEKDDQVYVYIKNIKHPYIVRYSIKALLDLKKKKKNWNGKWFMVFFDVPEIQRNKRDYIRKFLTKVGFFRYQKSVYLFPYECEKEIKLIKKIVEGARYMKYIIAERVEDEDIAKTFFHLH